MSDEFSHLVVIGENNTQIIMNWPYDTQLDCFKKYIEILVL